jgi:hypothetical protein
MLKGPKVTELSKEGYARFSMSAMSKERGKGKRQGRKPCTICQRYSNLKKMAFFDTQKLEICGVLYTVLGYNHLPEFHLRVIDCISC